MKITLDQARIDFLQAQEQLDFAWARGNAREMVEAKHNLQHKLNIAGRLVKEQMRLTLPAAKP